MGNITWKRIYLGSITWKRKLMGSGTWRENKFCLKKQVNKSIFIKKMCSQHNHNLKYYHKVTPSSWRKNFSANLYLRWDTSPHTFMVGICNWFYMTTKSNICQMVSNNHHTGKPTAITKHILFHQYFIYNKVMLFLLHTLYIFMTLCNPLFQGWCSSDTSSHT